MPLEKPHAFRQGKTFALLSAWIALTAFLVSCAPSTSPQPTTPAVQTDIPSLYQTFAGDFLIGAAVETDQLSNRRHADLLTRHFNSVTAENVMKPGKIAPSEGNFYWAGADKLVQFARDHHLAVHGHTLVWHNQTTGWMFNDSDGKPLEATPENKQLVLQRLETFIRAVVGRYQDAVTVWDVVNEVIDPNQPDCLRRSRYYELAGADYIAAAFRAADEAAPDAALILNDYDTTEPGKLECMYQVVGGLIAQGVPIDGVGHQMHINIENPSVDAIEQAILKFVPLGVEQHVTELDVSLYINRTDKYTVVPDEVLIQQGYRYKEIFEVFRRQAQYLDSVTFWGMADDHTWLTTLSTPRIDMPLLFDDWLQAKPAYWGVVDPSELPDRT